MNSTAVLGRQHQGSRRGSSLLGSGIAPGSVEHRVHMVAELPGAAANPIPVGREGLSPRMSESSLRVHGRGLFETSLGPKPAVVSRMVSIGSGCRPD